MPITIDTRAEATRIVATFRAQFGAWRELEQLIELLRLHRTPRVGAAVQLLEDTIVWDPSLPPAEVTRQYARACARYFIREGAVCSEAELVAVLEQSVARPRAVSRPARATRGARAR